MIHFGKCPAIRAGAKWQRVNHVQSFVARDDETRFDRDIFDSERVTLCFCVLLEYIVTAAAGRG